MIRLTIPEVPMTNNKLLRVHRMARRNITKRWMRLLLEALTIRLEGTGRLPRLRSRGPGEKRTVLIWVFRRRRLQDEDNFRGSLKPILDALKELRWIEDDSPKWIEQRCWELKTDGEARLEIELARWRPS